MVSGDRDRRGNAVLLAIGTVATNLLLVCVWMWWAFGTQNGFADLSVDMLKDPYVRDVVAGQVVGALQKQGMTSQVAIAAGPALKPMVSTVVGTPAFTGLVYAGARQLHQTVFTGNRSRMLIRVDDAGQMVKDSLRVANPSLAATIPDSALDIAVGVSQNTRLDAIVHTASTTGWFIWPLSALALCAYGVAIVRSRDRRRTVLRIGLLFTVGGFLWFVAMVAALAAASRFVDGPADRAALRAVFRSVTHVLMLSTRTMLNTGIVITLAALVAGEERVRSRLRTAAAWARREWSRPLLHGVLGTVIIVVGVLVAVYPEVVLALVARTIGLLLAFVGLVAVLDVLGAYGWSGVDESRDALTMRHVALVTGAGSAAIVVLLTFGGLGLFRSLNGTHVVSPDPAKGCNGHVELCDRRLDQVVLAGTHNSMSASAEKGWFVARQTGGIGAQLARGVRAFLIDAHYGTPVGGIVRTDFGSEAERAAGYAQLGTTERAVMNRLLGLLGATRTPESKRRVYLCHLYCELGATPAVDMFRKVDGFLAENPNEVIVFVVEDHVLPADLEAAVQRSGLDGHAYVYTPGTPLPTLREMIESRHNVLIMAEQAAGDQRWYPKGYQSLLQDTPYQFATTSDFTCTGGRGASTNVLFLMNHWLSVDPASPQVAARVNARQVLLDRVAGCRTVRGRLPNIIAVDFYASGELFDVVDELNAVDARRTAASAASAVSPTSSTASSP